jgi:hypothetical protein
MRPRVSARLPHRLHARLAGAAGRSAASQSAIIAAALESFLAERPDAGSAAALERRLDRMTRQLDRMTRQLDRLERNGLLLEETLALLAQAYLTLTPLVPADARAEAWERGAERWADFETRLAARLGGGRRTLGGVLESVAPAEARAASAEPVDGEAGASP